MAEVTPRGGGRLAVFRATGSAAVGGGHVVRCLALAEALAARGWHCRFAAGAETAATVPEAAARFPMITVSEEAPDREPEEIGAALEGPADLLVVDHYQRGETFERAARAWARTVLALDDLPNRRHDADLLLDQNGDRASDAYDGLLPPACKILVGPRYALLRSTFLETAVTAPAKERALRRIFVSMGATDATNLTAAALKGIRTALPAVEIDVLLSAAAPHLPSIRRLAEADPALTLHVGVRDVPRLMAASDLAVGTAGINLWERCVLGMPSLIVVAAENQRGNAGHVARLGGGEIVGEEGRLEPTRLEAALRRLAEDRGRLAAMSQAAQRICDGRGADRMAERLDGFVR